MRIMTIRAAGFSYITVCFTGKHIILIMTGITKSLYLRDEEFLMLCHMGMMTFTTITHSGRDMQVLIFLRKIRVTLIAQVGQFLDKPISIFTIVADLALFFLIDGVIVENGLCLTFSARNTVGFCGI